MLINHPLSQCKQTGSALISVLVIIIVVTILGVTAMRMGLTGLAIATNSQAGNLLFQTADLGLQRLQLGVNGGNVSANVATAMQAGGILGTTGDKALCMSTRGAVWGSGATAVNGFVDGACDANNAEQYVSGRNLAMAQVNYVRQPQSSYSSNSSMINLSATLGSSAAPIEPDVVTVTSTAIMPTLGSANISAINGCLARPSDDSGKLKGTDAVQKAAAAAVETITDCLTDSGAIFTSHQDMYLLGF